LSGKIAGAAHAVDIARSAGASLRPRMRAIAKVAAIFSIVAVEFKP
jgi:hypothetical protein